jgi:dynein heavy chain
VAEAAIQDILDTLRDVKFELEAVTNAVEEVGPFQNIVLQEAERMNSLIAEIVRSLLELDSGFKGDLTISDTMEDLANSLFLDRVPKKWEALAYPSLRGLAAWMSDLQLRIAQLNDWVAAPQETPICTWISGLFNPQSFLTAVMQTTAQKENLELDKLTLLTEVTKKMLAEEMSAPAKEGTYVIGLSLEGGSWSLQNALLEPSKPREMFSPLPVINVRPAVLDKQDPSLFQCPVYKTQSRGPTYVFSLQLRTKHEPGKWVLSSVVALLDSSA